MEYTFTKEQMKAGITPDYIFWMVKNKFGVVPIITCEGTSQLTVRIDGVDEKEYTKLFEEFTERIDENPQGTIVIERYNIQDRLDKLKQWAYSKGVKFNYIPKSIGCYSTNSYVNLQRFFFDRQLTDSETKEIKELLKTEWQISG